MWQRSNKHLTSVKRAVKYGKELPLQSPEWSIMEAPEIPSFTQGGPEWLNLRVLGPFILC